MSILESKGKGWITLYFIQLNLLLIFSVVVVEALRNYTTVIATVYEMGKDFNIITAVLGIWIGFIVYTVYLIIKSIRKIRKIKENPSRSIQ